MKNLFKLFFVAVLMLAATTVANAFGMSSGEGVAMAVTPVALPLLNQQAEKEMIKQFRHDNSWLAELKSKNQWVNNDVIKIPKQGAAPSVLINNQTYPIAKSTREDSHVVISLNKYDTTNTIVTEDELYALPYEKVSDVQTQHRSELEDVTAQHALHSIAPLAHSGTTPVLTVTGTAVGGRPTLQSKDLITLKTALDKLNVPAVGRILVLCPEHYADLMAEDRIFYQQYHNATNGTLSKSYYGFTVYQSNYNPTYNGDSEKVAFGATQGAKVASIVFHKNTAVKATGNIQRFARPSELDPENRENTVGFRLWFVAVAIRDEGVGALIG
ncbi:MAG: hypothetical protein ITG00_03400 [Flavobacterium sp.]|nr:hypothetical protein [Flavobacterium sp.]